MSFEISPYVRYEIKNGKPVLKDDSNLTRAHWEEFLLSMVPGQPYTIRADDFASLCVWAARYGIQLFDVREGYHKTVRRSRGRTSPVS